MQSRSEEMPPAADGPAADRPAVGWVVEGYGDCVLTRVRRPEVGLAVWHRDAAASCAAWLDRLAPDRLPSGRLLLRPRQVPEALAELFAACRTPAAPARAWLAEDIAGLAALYAGLRGLERVDLRLQAVDHDACWKFHRDAVALRLLTTYRGPGTEWVAAADAARALRLQRRYAGALRSLPRFAVALFKGLTADAAGGGEGAGVVHRSPPVAGSGTTRLLLCIDAPSEVSPAPWPQANRA